MIARILSSEARFDALLHPYRMRADRIMAGMNVFLFAVCTALAPWRDSWLALLVAGVPTLLLSFWLLRIASGELATRLFMACAFMAFTGLIIHQSGGQTEAHFAAFGLIGVLLYYRDWRTIAAATVFIYLHHMVLGYAQTQGALIYVFDSDRYWSTLAIHVAYFLPFIAMMCYLSIWLRREGYESQHVILLAQQILRGNLTETPQADTLSLRMPLIAAVVSMRDRLLELLRVLPVPAVVIRLDTERVVTVNRSWELQCTEIPADDHRFGDCPVWQDPADWAALLGRLRGGKQRSLEKIEIVMIRRDGSPAVCEVSMILLEDADPEMAILTAEDVTQRRQVEAEMQRLAYRDQLTDLPNRASLQREMAVARKAVVEGGEPYALVMLDLDGFKPLNDTYGHDVGDQALRVVGERIRHINRSGDFAARLGGDEFVVLIRNCSSSDEAALVARRLIKSISRPLHLKGISAELQLGASAGLAHSEDGASDDEALLKQADIALYRAKAAGRGCVVAFGSGDFATPNDQPTKLPTSNAG